MTQRNLLALAAGTVSDEDVAEAHRQALVNEAETAVTVELLRLRLGQLGEVLGFAEAGQ
ncbi:hypothetical protein [Streptomyces mirabilis]